MKSNRLIVSFATYVVLFVGGLACSDYLLGPVCVHLWSNIPPLTRSSRLVFVLPLLINSFAIFLAFLPFVKLTGMRSASRLFIAMTPLASLIAAGIYYSLLVKDRRSPLLYHKIGGDTAESIWVVVNVITALVPIASFLAVLVSLRGSRMDVRSISS